MLQTLFDIFKGKSKTPKLRWSPDGFIIGTNVWQKQSLLTPCHDTDCNGNGWSADHGGPYICPLCLGTGVA